MNWRMMCVVLGLSGLGVVQAAAVLDQRQTTQEMRLTPPGWAGPRLAAATTGAPQEGLSFEPEAVYNRHCVICHAAGVAGAPKLGDAPAWEPRVAQGLDTLVKHVVEGYNAMPAKGTCMECTAEHIKATVVWMLAE